MGIKQDVALHHFTITFQGIAISRLHYCNVTDIETIWKNYEGEDFAG